MIVHMLLEGRHELPLARALIRYCGHEPGFVYGGKGCAYVRKYARNFLYLARPGSAVLVLTDFMDSGSACPSEACRLYLSGHRGAVPASFLCRFAVNELESWLMADREGLASFLQIPAARIPSCPEQESDPKRTLVNLARLSKNNRLRHDLIPPPRHGGMVGPGYTLAITDFINGTWSPGRAEANAPSLARCIKRLRGLAARQP